MLPTTTSDTVERLLQRSAAAVVMVAGELAIGRVADDGGAVKIWRGRGEIRRWRGGAGCGRRRREVGVCCGAAVSLCASQVAQNSIANGILWQEELKLLLSELARKADCQYDPWHRKGFACGCKKATFAT
ncbi:lysine--tRNA ligase [Striga asiatica]|uniref:Lysine--tRNA ligase n=1 Tax=Striga asiatica TaxID=4170 RepID=A0A5A7PUK6_STRAF|nr:lysine--tRNA ligase [Striga asiatica]